MEIRSPLAGTVWKILVQPGDAVAGGDTLIILESMKMEINVDTLFDGTVTEIRKAEGDTVQADEILAIVED
jgi:acetyl-CoA carboxylase biotin carboxyl carrier protein